MLIYKCALLEIWKCKKWFICHNDTEKQKKFGWAIKRNLARIRIHTDTIKNKLVPEKLNLISIEQMKILSKTETIKKLK